ncbi:hypothetical protein WL1483_3452 [Aeromonas schubertii]|uniref:Uncharacterized protein n=1 Tax=Aeromonas schubertii TaxID=652 RepID=A0A0S2SMJ8_9GAMM|nr:hypothetical protein WL1483_3452 [Aeromonas schubertii]
MLMGQCGSVGPDRRATRGKRGSLLTTLLTQCRIKQNLGIFQGELIAVQSTKLNPLAIIMQLKIALGIAASLSQTTHLTIIKRDML